MPAVVGISPAASSVYAYGSTSVPWMRSADGTFAYHLVALDAKRSAKRINNVLNVLSKILRYAVEIEMLDRIPRIKTLKVPPHEFDFFTFEELEALVATSADEPEWQVAGEAGLRLGELLALEWTDIDFKNEVLHVLRHTFCSHRPESRPRRHIPTDPPPHCMVTVHPALRFW